MVIIVVGGTFGFRFRLRLLRYVQAQAGDDLSIFDAHCVSCADVFLTIFFDAVADNSSFFRHGGINGGAAGNDHVLFSKDAGSTAGIDLYRAASELTVLSAVNTP